MEKDQSNWAFFDFDDTISQGDSILWWNRYLYQKHFSLRLYGILHLLLLPLVAFKLMSKMTFKRFLLLPAGNLSKDKRTAYAEDFLKNHLQNQFYPEVLEILKKHKADGFKVAVLSASADFYLLSLPQLLPIDHFRATKMSYPEEGGWFHLPNFEEPNFKAQKKVEYLESSSEFKGGDKNSFGYSDHHSDHFLLEYAETGVCINPNKKLAAMAKEKGWEILIPKAVENSFLTKLSKLRLFLFGWI